MIGLLFASFGVTLLIVSIPMGHVSDRIGRKAPMVGGPLRPRGGDAPSSPTPTVCRGCSPPAWCRRRRRHHLGRRLRVNRGSVPARGARPRQRHRDVGHERRLHGRTVDRRLDVRSGWHPRAVSAGRRARDPGRARLHLARHSSTGRGNRAGRGRVVLRSRPVAVCAAVVVAISATLTMEGTGASAVPQRQARPRSGRASVCCSAAAPVASSILHPIYGRLADRWGGRRMMLTGLPLVACVLPLINPDLELPVDPWPSSY